MTPVRISRPTRLMTVVAAAAAATALAGCGTNINAQTQEWYDPTDGANSSIDDSISGMAARDVVVVSDGTDATVNATFVNIGSEPDAVTSITVDGEDADITGDLDVDPTKAVRVGPPGEARAQVDGAGLEPGITATVEITFQDAGAQTLTAIVRSPSGEFEDSGPE